MPGLVSNVVLQEMLAIAPGSLTQFPIDLRIASMIQVALSQVSLTQDFSLRAWISVYPNGIPVPPGYTPVLRANGLPIVIYTPTQTPPMNTIGVPVAPGQYVLNVFNLTNEPNVLGYTVVTLG